MPYIEKSYYHESINENNWVDSYRVVNETNEFVSFSYNRPSISYIFDDFMDFISLIDSNILEVTAYDLSAKYISLLGIKIGIHVYGSTSGSYADYTSPLAMPYFNSQYFSDAKLVNLFPNGSSYQYYYHSGSSLKSSTFYARSSYKKWDL